MSPIERSGAAPTSLPPSGPAGGDLGGTYPNPSVAAITETSGPTQLIIGSIADGSFLKRGGGTIQGANAPGSEINYTQITASVNVTGTTSATATTVLSPGAITFDGTPVLVTVFSPTISMDSAAVGDLFRVRLFEGATEIGIIAQFRSDVTTTTNTSPCHAAYRFTPSAASHTYTIKCTVTSTTGTPNFGAGNGGTDAALPAFVRFTKI